jgi:hypothetical protein
MSGCSACQYFPLITSCVMLAFSYSSLKLQIIKRKQASP